jgi:nucleotide-binding universal stress UspA family protein
MNKKRLIVIMGLVAAITALHYFTSPTRTPLHIFYRELYFIPIILAGLWGGKKGGLITSISISLIYLPHVFILARFDATSDHHMMMNMIIRSAESYWGNAFQLLLFNLAGFLAGAYSDLKRGYVHTKGQPYHPTRFEKDFLLCVEESPASLYAAKYFADIFGNSPDIGVTLFWVSSGTDPDYFETTEKASDYERELLQKGETLLGQVKDILVRGGIDEDRIQLKVVAAGRKAKISDKILEHLKEGNYGTIVVGKHGLSKSQEFLFGSVAINLVRQAPINVLTVKGLVREGTEDIDSTEAGIQ